LLWTLIILRVPQNEDISRFASSLSVSHITSVLYGSAQQHADTARCSTSSSALSRK
jgi:hypothetical protein